MKKVRARYLMASVVEASQRSVKTVNLEDVASGTGRLIGSLEVRAPTGQNLFRSGDVLFGKLRPYLSKSLLVSDDLQGSGEFLCLRPGPAVDQRYLFYYTLSRPWLDHAVQRSYGLKMPRTSWEQLADFRMRAPTLYDQRRVADFLDHRVARIDSVIRVRQRQRMGAGEAYASQLASRVDEAGKKFGWTLFRRFAPRITQGWSPQASNEPASRGEPGVIRLGIIRSGNFNAAENKAFLPNVEPRNELRLANGDLLMTRANTPSLVGDVGVVTGLGIDQRLYLSDLVYRISCPRVQVDFASAALRSPRVRQVVAVVARGTSGSMPKLRAEDIADLPVPLAPWKIQAEIAQWDLKAREELVRVENLTDESSSRLNEYRQSLITAAVMGQIDVTASGSNIPG